MCMGWTWYLGDDMIFFVVGLLILPIYRRRRWMGWLTVGVLSCASFGVTMWLCLKHHLGVYTFDKHYEEQSYWIYNRTYTRIPAYFIGIVSAWVLSEMEQKGFTREARPFTFRARA